MPTQQRDQQQADRERDEGQRLNAAIGENVLRDLGRPGDLLTVQVRRLWEGHYRVNVFVGPDAASATVAHSYYLVADGGGNITESTPAIARRY
jgi:hypothetical protein